MAGSLFELVGRVIVTGVDQFNRSMSQVESKTLGLAGKLDNLSQRSAKVGRTLTRNVTLPIVGLGIAAIKTGADFDKAMTRSLSIVDGVTGDIRKQFDDMAVSISKNTTFSATEVAEAFYFLAGAGLDTNQMLKAMGVVADYAQAGNIDLAQATEQLTDVLGALGLNTKDATQYQANMAHVSDVLTKASKIADAQIGEYTESLMKAGGTLKLYNKDVVEGTAVLAAYATAGKKGVEAGELLHIMIRDLARAGKNNEDQWRAMGLAVYDSNGKMRNLGDIISELDSKLGGMSDKQKRAALESLGFRDKSILATTALLGMGEAIKSYEASLRDVSGYTKEVAAATMLDFWSQMKILRNHAQAVAITLWQVLGPALKDHVVPAMRGLVAVLQDAVNFFNSLPAPVRNFVLLLISLAAILGPLLLVFSGVLAVTSKMIVIIGLLKVAFAGLFMIIGAHPIGLLLTAIGLLIIAGVNLIRTYGGVEGALNAAWSSMRNTVRQMVGEMLSDIVNFIEGSLLVFKRLADHPVAKLLGLDVFGKHIDSALAWINKFKGATAGLFTTPKKEAQEFGETFEQATDGADQKVKAFQASLQQDGGFSIPQGEVNGFKSDVGEMGTSLNLFGNDFMGLQNKMKVRIPYTEKSGFTNDLNEMSQERAKFEQDWSNKVLEQSGNRIAILRREKTEALAEAKRLGASRLDIIKYYDQQERQIHRERMMEFVTTTQSIVNNLMGVWSDYTSARIAQIDRKAQADIQAIRDSSMSEEEKARRIKGIENKADEDRRNLQRKQARREKALAIFNAVINGAVAFTKALTLGPVIGWILAAMIAASVGAQIALIAAKPLPFAKGGFVKGGKGGVTGEVGEGRDDEIVFPLQTGIGALVDALIKEVNSRPMPRLPSLPYVNADTRSITGGIRHTGRGYESPSRVASDTGTMVSGPTNHWHIGVLVADDRGIKELERRQQKFRVAENQRRGHLL